MQPETATPAKEKRTKTAAKAREKKVKKRGPSQRKLAEVKKLSDFLKNKAVVGIVDIKSLPSAQFQEIRKKLRGKADIRITKTILLKKALEKAPEEVKKLEQFMTGPCGIIVSNENPFALFKFIKQNKSRAAAKTNDIAPDDIVVPAGETDMPAGPALAELKQAGIDVKIDKGKIAVAKDSTVAKKGEKISQKAAAALIKLGITPMEIGLKITAVSADKTIYTSSTLDIDEEKFMKDLQTGFLNALNLSVNAGFPNKTSVTFMIQKAARNANNLSVNAAIPTKQTIRQLIAKAQSQATALSQIAK